MECPFVVGDKVVCVDAGPMRDVFTRLPVCPSGLVNGRVYTVSCVRKNEIDPTLVVLCVAEQRRPFTHAGQPGGFSHARFQPVRPKRTDLTLEAFFKVPGGYEEPRRTPTTTPIKEPTDAQ